MVMVLRTHTPPHTGFEFVDYRTIGGQLYEAELPRDARFELAVPVRCARSATVVLCDGLFNAYVGLRGDNVVLYKALSQQIEFEPEWDEAVIEHLQEVVQDIRACMV